VGASQLPFHYLLALKSPYNPLRYLTGRTHESLNALHQLLGRVVTILIYVHAALYLNLYVLKGLLGSKLREPYIIAGVFGVLALTAVGTTALGFIRRWRYRVFYTVHVVLATALLPVLWFHVSHIRVYLYETAAVYVLNAILRNLSSRTVSASITLLDGGSLINISISKSTDQHFLRRWQPGQHAYLSLPGHPVSRTLRSNPFSVASVPSADGELRFVARILDGNTAKLAQAAKSEQRHNLTIEGPYGRANHADDLLRYDRVLFVAGGVGGTFVAPLYRQLLSDLSPSCGSARRRKVEFAWVARDEGDVRWAVPADEKERVGFLQRMSVWVTGRVDGLGEDRGSRLSADQRVHDEMEDGIELEERKGLLGPEGTDERPDATGDLSVKTGRPDLQRIVDRTFMHDDLEKVAVVVCGPKGLTRTLRTSVETWVLRGRYVWLWEESFAF